MKIEYLNGGTEDHLGFTRYFIKDEAGAPSIREQLNANYAHGGGWRPFGQGQWELQTDMGLAYPGDPPYSARAKITFDNFPEQLWVYDSAWFMILNEDATFEVARMD